MKKTALISMAVILALLAAGCSSYHGRPYHGKPPHNYRFDCKPNTVIPHFFHHGR